MTIFDYTNVYYLDSPPLPLNKQITHTATKELPKGYWFKDTNLKPLDLTKLSEYTFYDGWLCVVIYLDSETSYDFINIHGEFIPQDDKTRFPLSRGTQNFNKGIAVVSNGYDFNFITPTGKWIYSHEHNLPISKFTFKENYFMIRESYWYYYDYTGRMILGGSESEEIIELEGDTLFLYTDVWERYYINTYGIRFEKLGFSLLQEYKFLEEINHCKYVFKKLVRNL